MNILVIEIIGVILLSFSCGFCIGYVLCRYRVQRATPTADDILKNSSMEWMYRVEKETRR